MTISDMPRFPPGVRALALNESGQVLLLKRPDEEKLFGGHWNLPGGAQEDNESPFEGAQRELLEETGLSADPDGGSMDYFFTGGCGRAFSFVRPNGEFRLETRESSEARWFDPEDLPSPLMPGTEEIVKTLLEIPEKKTIKTDSLTTRVNRCDRGTMASVTRTPQGYLKLDGYATRTGVLIYRNPDGSTRRELRHPDDVTRPDSLATLAGVAVTDEHPPSLLDSMNTSKYAKGYTGDTVEMEGERVKAPLTITDAYLIQKVEAREQQELSCGYSCDLVIEPGVWNGEPFDARQTNITYNHLAVVRKGRAGPDVGLRLDAAEQIADKEPHDELEEPMARINIDGAEYEVSEGVATAYTIMVRNDAKSKKDMEEEMDAKKKEIQEMDSKLKVAKEELDGMTSKCDKESARADASEEALKSRMDTATIDARVKERLELVQKAAAVLPKDTKLDGMSDQEIRIAVIKDVSPSVNLDGKSEDYIGARFDSAVELAATRVDSTSELRKLVNGVRQDGAGSGDKVAEARERLRKDNQDAWKKPIGIHKGGN